MSQNRLNKECANLSLDNRIHNRGEYFIKKFGEKKACGEYYGGREI